MSKTPWVVFDAKTGLGVCLRCGKVLNLPLPQPILVFVAATKAFCKIHKNCPKMVKSKEPTAG